LKKKELIRFSTIYGSLKYFKNKIIKNIQNIQKTPQFSKSIKNKCVTSSQEQQHEVCLLRKKEQKSLKFNRKNEDTDTSEELDNNSVDISFTSDASAKTDITICSQEDNNKSHKCNHLASRNNIKILRKYKFLFSSKFIFYFRI